MTSIDFDFQRYVRLRQGDEQRSEHGGPAYAYPGDQKVLRTLGRVTPVKLAAEATVRLWYGSARAQLLGSGVKVTRLKFGELNACAEDCANRLRIAPPTLYVAPELETLNAHTFGTRDDAYIVLSGVLVDHLDAQELKFVIGHECGHIHNDHVVFNTALYYLRYSANVFVRWIVQPAILALQSWARRAEISCDRAGLLCCGDLDVGTKALVKLALGSQGTAGETLPDELLRSHPHLPKRLAALRLFARTHYFRAAAGLASSDAPGESLNWCDARVGELLSVFGQEARPDDDEAPGDPGEPKEA